MKRTTLLLMLCTALFSLSTLWAQEVYIDTEFTEDPAGDWTVNTFPGGQAPTWDEAGERLIVTQALNSQGASAFYNEVFDINNFYLEATVKLCCGSHADGMTISFIEGDVGTMATAIGAGGGGMCAAGLTSGAQITIEFDIWGNGAAEMCPKDTAGDAGGNHIGVEYSPTGFASTDQFPGAQVGNNCDCAGPNELGFSLYGNHEFNIVVQLQDSVVTVDVECEAQGVPMHRVITKTFENYESFEGLVGFTGSTGGANAEQSISRFYLASLDNCIAPPGMVTRTADTGQHIDLEGSAVPAYDQDSPIAVSLEITDLREAEGACDVPEQLIITELLPLDWSPENISDGGVYAPEDGEITWTLSGGAIALGKTVTYTAVPGGDFIPVTLSGNIKETADETLDIFAVNGDTLVTTSDLNGLNANGDIVRWLLLGPYILEFPVGTDTAAAQQDFLTDDETTEMDILPEADAIIETDFVAAASFDLGVAANPDINPEGLPQWFEWLDMDEKIDVGSDLCFGALDNVMCYGACYITVEEEITVIFASGSDDGIQLILDDQEIWVNAVERGFTDLIDLSEPVTLLPGQDYRLLAKCFETGGAWSFGVGLRDSLGLPLQPVFLDQIRVTLTPSEVQPTGVFVNIGDVNGDGNINLADAISLLTYLFVDKNDPGIGCLKNGDAKDDGNLNLADAITILSYQFTNGTLTAPDGTLLGSETAGGAKPAGCYEYPEAEVSDLGCAAPCAK